MPPTAGAALRPPSQRAAASGRLALIAMVMTVAGQALGLAIGGVSAFATPAVGRAYLAGMPEALSLEFPSAMMAVFALALLLMFVGNMLLGLAVMWSGALPAGAGVLWLVSALLFYVLGVVMGTLTTGASLPAQPIGAALMALAGWWLAFGAFRVPAGGRASHGHAHGTV